MTQSSPREAARARPAPHRARTWGTPQQSGLRFDRLLERAGSMVYRLRVRPRRGFEYVGGATLAITGRAPADFYANANLPSRAVHPDDGELVSQAFGGASGSRARGRGAVVLRWLHRDGHVVWAEHRRAPVLDADGRVVAVDGIATDVTDRVEAERRLHGSEQQLRQLAARAQIAREEERTAIARELHDELGQTLTAIKLELVRAVTVLRKEHLDVQAVDRFQSLVGLVEIGLSTVKRIATDLRPPTLDHLGLAEAIRWEAVAFGSRTGLRCRVRAETEGRGLTPEQQIVVFRIFQESLTNVVRHARASAVQVVLKDRAGHFELRVRDNGRGITQADVRHPGAIGLLGMRERASLIGGTFRIEGRRGKGTAITVRVPAPGGRGGARGRTREAGHPA